jgi:hypothetical protein
MRFQVKLCPDAACVVIRGYEAWSQYLHFFLASFLVPDRRHLALLKHHEENTFILDP